MRCDHRVVDFAAAENFRDCMANDLAGAQ
jgi:hypothetical protein